MSTTSPPPETPPSPAPTITVIGSLNTDLVTLTPRVPSSGETLISTSFSTSSGGKGANQAVACARTSRPSASSPVEINVRMVGAVGDDTFGQDLLNDLRSNGIETADVAVKQGERSGVAVIVVEEASGENRILMNPGANFSLKPSDFVRLPDPVPDLLVLQLEIPLDTTLQILRAAKEKKIEVVLNPAPAQRLPQEAWSAVRHLIVNESEASIITGFEAKQPSWLTWGPHMEALIALGVPYIIITLGAKGVVYLDTVSRLFWRYPARKVNVVDTTAAGDTFVGAYAVAMVRRIRQIREGGQEAAVRWANKCAAKTVERRGAQSAIPWGEEVGELEDVEDNGRSFEEYGKMGG